MSYLVFARKYRPQNFEQVVKQEHVTKVLSNAIASNRVPHAVIFSGPRGTGKTTIARIFAKAMNCVNGPTSVPCNVCSSCTEITHGNASDVFEIDGASNNSVEQVRELRENIRYLPVISKYKIYIIDEVHMLSNSAFNALLKTLEEPPSHVMFIFATTEPHKIPLTILSRCQKYDFRRINIKNISEHLANICNQENVQINKNTLDMISKESDGCMRDALSLLDQIVSCFEGIIDHDKALDILGVLDSKVLFDLSNGILKGDFSEIIQIIDKLYHGGHDLKKIFIDLMEYFRNLLFVKKGIKSEQILNSSENEINLMGAQVENISEIHLNQILDIMFKEEYAIKSSEHPKTSLEIALMKLVQIKPALSVDILINRIDLLRKNIGNPGNIISPEVFSEAKTIKSEPESGSILKSEPAMPPEKQEKINIQKSKPSLVQFPDEDLNNKWEKIMAYVGKKRMTLKVNLNKSKLLSLTDKEASIEMWGNKMEVHMVQADRSKDILKEAFLELFNKNVQIKIIGNVSDEKKKGGVSSINKAYDYPLVSEAVEIFQGTIVKVNPN
ncbi:MAG: DNA polymerase III subunit gamma/tau [Desulfobacterales bacterium]|nr:DNA polymerase III subunit gamma/tau [Desulfobacterales bacterium]